MSYMIHTIHHLSVIFTIYLMRHKADETQMASHVIYHNQSEPLHLHESAITKTNHQPEKQDNLSEYTFRREKKNEYSDYLDSSLMKRK